MADKCFAFKQKGVISPDTLAGGIGAINMTHTVSFVGPRAMGVWDIQAKTFTANADGDTPEFTFDPTEGKREEFQVYYVPQTSPSTPFWLGKGNEDMGIGMNPQTEEKDDVQGNYVFNVQTYRKSMTVDPLNLDGTDPYSVAVAEIFLYEKTYSDCELEYIVVMVPYKLTTP